MPEEEEPEAVPFITVLRPREGIPLVETGTGVQVPREIRATYIHPTGPFVVHLIVVIGDDGVPYPAQIVMRPKDDTVRDHRRIESSDTRLPIKWIIDNVVTAAVEQEATEPVEVSRPPRNTRRVLTREVLEEVADVVRDATVRGVPIRRAVAEHFRLGSELTARNWIAAARKPGGPLHRDIDTEEK